ncbi:hypothetical protein A2X44_03335 [candidate division CPR3 bacterium GWF2_35_18]|nr:MAG: hypothetical protein A2X44_03335 [candidate division CPR3 bacterium GWF2_35_18]OGB63964.1 MAG: hypothetical protein A2250_02870 [candidate division CPR3 bacterium RIFOXYA2_FULL_35_13]OGB77270.1 MAG: hypothetical protein A2476_03995 [candidate division CPR3 bacterium RIFOXYC2_FULL_35_7]OGB78416.1 MAG: hypothetical protein A2296_03550 [candidate division CPR3 bacterium RIFOXYB2_FULL_35_8]
MKIDFLDTFWTNIAHLFTQGDFSFIGIMKIVTIVFLLFYLFFAFLTVRQVQIMNQFLNTNLSPWTKIVAWIYFLYTLCLLFLVISIRA